MYFIANEDIYAQYNNVMKEAEKELVIVTPWYQPTGHMKANVEDLLLDDVILHLVTRPKDINNYKHKKNIEELEDLVRNIGEKVNKKEGGLLGIGAKEVEKDRLRITYVPELHAKMVMADGKIAVLSSSNLIETSLSSNFEAGILVDKREDFDDCNFSKNFLKDALSFVEMLEQKFGNTVISHQNNKKCTSCGKILWNPNYEICFNCNKMLKQNVEQTQRNEKTSNCPKCGRPKKPQFALCYVCAQNPK